MVAPTTAIKHYVDLFNNSSNVFGMSVPAIEGSEDSDSRMGKRCIIVYADLDRQADLDTDKKVIKVPCSIYIIINSDEFETAAESFNQAFNVALECYSLVAADNRPALLNTENVSETIHLQAQGIPLTILRKSASCSSIQLAFSYFIKGM
jgi:hypothetical protein